MQPEESGCILWMGSLDGRGYGQINDTTKRRPVRATRVLYEMANGPIPEGGCVCHSCDNPRCVNVAHLWVGTHKENMRDMFAKGRRKTVAISGAAWYAARKK
jgi:hypothetical protein